jgi:hypothetical protein
MEDYSNDTSYVNNKIDKSSILIEAKADVSITYQNDSPIGNDFKDVIPMSNLSLEIKKSRKDWICPWCELKFRDPPMVLKRRHFKSCSKLKNKTIRSSNHNRYNRNRSNRSFR